MQYKLSCIRQVAIWTVETSLFEKLQNPGQTNRSRVVNRIKFHFPVSECYNRVDNRIGNIAKIIG